MISQTAEYALRAVVYLAGAKGQPRTTQQIAEKTKVSSGYLSKVLQALGRAGIVASQRGLHGGFTLLQEPEELTIYDIVNVVDPIHRIHTCPLGLRKHGVQLCPLHRRLDDAMATVEEAFTSTTLAELMSDSKNPSKPLCG